MSLGIVLVAISGFFTGLVGTGRRCAGLGVECVESSQRELCFPLSSASIDIGADLLRAAIYLKNGYMDWNQWFDSPLLFGVAAAGAYTGKIILSKINQKQFELIVGIFVMLSGVMMLFA